MELLSKILVEGSGERFLSFTNADSKMWIVPIKNMRTALNLYQPSSINGRLVKWLLPSVYRIGAMKRKIGLNETKISLSTHIKDQICSLFDVADFQFSIFGGTPSSHQKITIQISCHKTILGYVKLTDNDDIKAMFSGEKLTLDRLRDRTMTNIPQCLYCGEFNGGIAMFAQTTTKSGSSQTLHKFTSKHWEFLGQLHLNTKQSLAFNKSDFYKTLLSLTEQSTRLEAKQRELILSAINKIESHNQNRVVEFSACHGDFTPWNMFVEKGELFVFDFEYAKMSFPPHLDWFHHFTQTSIFEKHLSSGAIYDKYLREKARLATYFDKPDSIYICYLLSIIELYMSREPAKISEQTTAKIERWLELLNLLSPAK